MSNSELLVILKVDLGISNTAYDERLTQYIESARSKIKEEGINLNDSINDDELIVMYAAYIWRNRASGNAMPRMLRYALNNRLMSEKMRGE